jgi:hypothetical protein
VCSAFIARWILIHLEISLRRTYSATAPGKERHWLTKWFQFIGEVTLFGVRAIGRSFRSPSELQTIWNQIEEVGSTIALACCSIRSCVG